MKILINGVAYSVGIASIVRSIRKAYKYNVKTEDGIEHSEVRGTYLDFTLSLGNVDKASYDRLMKALAASGNNVTVELPMGFDTTEIYTGSFDSVSDEVVTEDSEGVYWDNLALSFRGAVPLEVNI